MSNISTRPMEAKKTYNCISSCWLRLLICMLLFLLLMFGATASAATFTGEAVTSYNGERVLMAGKKVTINWK